MVPVLSIIVKSKLIELSGHETRRAFLLCFCSLFPLFVDLDRAQSTKTVEMRLNNQTVETLGLTRKTNQCALSPFVQHKTKQLEVIELHNQLVLQTVDNGKTIGV